MAADIAPLRCRFPRYFAGPNGFPGPEDRVTDDPRFGLNGNHHQGWTIVPNGSDPLLFTREYGLEGVRFPTQRQALEALHTYLQFESELPAEQQTISPVRPPTDGG